MKGLNQPTFEEWATGKIQNHPNFDKFVEGCHPKWKTITKDILSKFQVPDDTNIKVSAWLEMMSEYDTLYMEETLRSEYEKLVEKIKSIPNKRIGIVRKVWNFNLRITEYELEDGTYVPTEREERKTLFPLLELDPSVFPDSFLKLFHKNEYRQKQIDRII